MFNTMSGREKIKGRRKIEFIRTAALYLLWLINLLLKAPSHFLGRL
jgi:hypothetical protein